MSKSRSSTSESNRGPSEEELKLLRAKFHNRFHKFSNALETGGLRIKANKQEKSTIKKRKSIWDEEFAPTVFEEINGTLRPAPARMYIRDMKPKKQVESPVPSEERKVRKRRSKASKSEPSSERSLRAEKPAKSRARPKLSSSSSVSSKREAQDLNVARREKKKKKVKRPKENKEKAGAKQVDSKPGLIPSVEEQDALPGSEREAVEQAEPVLVDAKAPETESESAKTPETPLTSGDITPLTSGTSRSSIDVSFRDIEFSEGGVPREKSEEPISERSKNARKKAKKMEIKKVLKEKLFEELTDDIQLDDKVLQEIAEDLKKGKNYDPKLIDQNMANKILEAEKSPTEAEMKMKQEEAYEKSEVANKIVNKLTHSNVLGKVLTPEESKILSQYFSGEVQLNDEVLNVLNTALEKILDRAPEFYDNKEEIKKFVANRDAAKKQLLDALLSRNASFLKNLYTNAFFYADMISKGFSEAVRYAGVAKDGLAQGYAKSVSVMNESYSQGKEVVNKTYAVMNESYSQGKEVVNKTYAVGRDVAQQASRYYNPAASITKDFVEMARKDYVSEEEDAEKKEKEKKVWEEAGWLKRTWWFIVKIFVVLAQDTSMHRRIGESSAAERERRNGNNGASQQNDQVLESPKDPKSPGLQQNGTESDLLRSDRKIASTEDGKQ
ncbi:unnamed protein product [Bursaphelenchus xylophilus]|uniref:(pine wood nematode) hypothetical protein n=1 Tax=Bursaphelenchus xylophilus TaxID=6326 RepID=A0A1I7RK82_BURXY|nr:unnamed protein product [Bursaphelenchus xylophilus]CAG9131433.1 unnamed protein product [Bursaphelenchus xylophilus]